jgi:hypothetical protein
MQRRCCAAATSAPALLCHERRACLLFASSARPFLDASRSHAGVCVAAVPRGALRAPLRAPPHPAAPLRRPSYHRRCALPCGHPARSGQRRGGLRRAERRPDVLAGRRGPHRPGAPQTQPRALTRVASLTPAAPRRCLGRTGCATRLAWLTQPTGAGSCAPHPRWTGARNARPCRHAPSRAPHAGPRDAQVPGAHERRSGRRARSVGAAQGVAAGAARTRVFLCHLLACSHAQRRRTAPAAGSRACGSSRTVRAASHRVSLRFLLSLMLTCALASFHLIKALRTLTLC